MSTVLISGGTGLVGRRLSSVLNKLGYEVMHLSRAEPTDSTYPTYKWNPDHQEIADDAISRADYIIHLAGVNISEIKWSDKRKQQILESRVKSGELLVQSIRKNEKKIKAFISASAVGFYGAETSERIFNEDDNSASDFLGKTCESWEKPARAVSSEGIRSVVLRIGLVLAQGGGALPKMIAPIKYGVGSALGDGKQYIPWIHIDDLIGIIVKSIKDEQLNGAYNAVAPATTNNEMLIKTAASILKKPLFMPKVPAALLRLFLGEMSDIVLKGSRVSAEKILHAGYRFIYPELRAALKDLLLDSPEEKLN